MVDANIAVDIANSEFFYSNVKSVTTNFNVSPYYDDFDGLNNYYKILFKPGYAVQARELTQLQSILQEQISRFGQHVFKEGSMVLGGKFNLDKRAHYVKVKDFDSFDNPVDITAFRDQIVTGQITGIKAYVNLVLGGTEGTDTPKTLYVSYLSGNPDTDEVVFTANEPLVSNVGTLVVGNTIPVGYGSVFTINEGIRFAKEHFIYHSKQAVVVDRYGINPTCKVGFVLEEAIVNSSEDSTLLDPALESSNYSAPGADRFKINAILTRLDINDVAGFPDYVDLFIIEDGKVIESNERPVYNVLRDEIAKRTMDESGHYYVRGFNPIIEEHLDTGNGGYLSAERGGNPLLLSAQIESGTGYVKGYEINKLVTTFLDVPKSIEFANVNGQVISTSVGSYIVVNEAVGAWNLDFGQNIDLYDTAQKRISRGVSSTASQTGNKIGSAKIKSISRNSGTLGSPDGTIKVHLFDISMLGSNSFSSVKSVYYSNPSTSDVGADVVTSQNGITKLNDPYSDLLYYVGSNHTKTIRSPDGTIDTTFFFKKTTDVSIVNTGTFSLTASIPNEFFPYGTSTLSTADKLDILLTLNESFNIALPGTVISGGGLSNTIIGASSYFTNLNVGDKIELSGNSSTFIISSISNNSVLTVSSTLPSVLSGNLIYKAYKSGDMIDLNGIGSDSGVTRSVTSTTNSLTFDLQETLGNIGDFRSGTITYTMVRSNAREIRKDLRTNRYVLIDCGTNIGANTGPYSLGISDVYNIRSIRQASSFTTVNDGIDVTSNFVLDNGQRDNSYRNASIIPYTTLTPSDKLLVCLDYFQPDYTLGVGYFSIDSYPVNDINPLSNQITTPFIPVFRSPDTNFSFNLRNYFDFRPVYTNSASDATSLAGVTTNPIESTTLQYEASGLRLPADSESILFDYSYYLARKDIITLNENGNFMLTQGVPAIVPITPACPSHLMPIARLYISPYPSLSPFFAKLIGRSDLACGAVRTSQVRYTMKDIGVLKQRIDNLENYVSLSLLEKNAVDMKILDENGLDRFKNGIFVDSFTSFRLSDYGNPDHRISYDPKEGSIRPIFDTEAIGYTYVSGSNVIVKNNLLMLPYSEVVALTQPNATTIRNVETTTYRFVGKLYLDPPSDYWVNTKRLATQTFSFGATSSDITPYSTVYGSWQTAVTGVTTSDPTLLSSSGSVTGVTPGTTVSSTTNHTLNFNEPVTFGGGGAVGSVNIPGASGSLGSATTIDSLISTYGGSTPVTLSGGSAGGRQAYAPFSIFGPNIFTGTTGISLANDFTPVKTLDDIKSNASEYAGLNNFNITIASVTGGTTTTTTTNTYATTTTTATQATRDYVSTFQNLKTDTRNLGDRVVSVAPIADIRPQTIGFEARGVKATTRYYVFFDGQLMSSYVSPARAKSNTEIAKDKTLSTYTTVAARRGPGRTKPPIIGANTTTNLYVPVAPEGSPLYSNSDGIAYGLLRLPSDSTKSFRTGTKEVIVTDSPTNEPDATSSAKGYFAAQGITQTLQDTIVSVSTVVTSTSSGVDTAPTAYSNTTNTYTTTSSSTTGGGVSATAILSDVVSCMAYSFKLNTPRGEEGTFLSSIDVFFSSKHPTLGVWFEIRAMDNAGTITKVQVPDSEVWLEPEDVNVSDDGSVPTNVKFDVPIFLLNNQEYAFVIHTVGINPSYYMFVSVLGQTDILTKKPVNTRPLTGTLYTTNNNTDWDIVNRVDLKCTFYRAKFQTGVLGEAILGNDTREYIQLPLTIKTGANTSWFGEQLIGNDELYLSIPEGTIEANDILVGANSGANAIVQSVDGSKYRMRNHHRPNSRFERGETITCRRANGYLTTITSNVVSKNTASGFVYNVKPKNDKRQFNGNTAILVVHRSNGEFREKDAYGLQLSGNTAYTVDYDV